MVASTVGHDVVWLQGRYLVPIGPLLLVTLAGVVGPAGDSLRRSLPVAVLLFLTGAEIATARSVVGRYYRRGEPAGFEWIARDRGFREAAQPDAVVATFAAALSPPRPALVALYARAVQAEFEQRPDAAIEAYREIVRTDPDVPLVARPLATLLLARASATPAEQAEVERLARSACRASGFEDPLDLERLVAALVAQGRPREAAAHQRRAIALARAIGDEPLVIRLERALAAERGVP
jgi:tetratricopeptide (TPR) repeat protein